MNHKTILIILNKINKLEKKIFTIEKKVNELINEKNSNDFDKLLNKLDTLEQNIDNNNNKINNLVNEEKN